jgi:hypothetical protein
MENIQNTMNYNLNSLQKQNTTTTCVAIFTVGGKSQCFQRQQLEHIAFYLDALRSKHKYLQDRVEIQYLIIPF